VNTFIYIMICMFIFGGGMVVGHFLNVFVHRSAAGYGATPERHPCRKAKISRRDIIATTLCGAVGLSLFIHISPPQRALLFFAVFCVLLAMALIDADTHTISDGMSIALGILAVVSIWVGPEVDMPSRLIGLAVVSVPLFITAILARGAFGLGDVFLMIPAGFLLGTSGVLTAFFIGIIGGGIYGAYALIRRKKNRKDFFAFGPCLAVGIFTSLLFGQDMVYWYLAVF
jgi:leader peptidase (prepilin peptidase)/N-methyltransferase